MPTRNSGEFGRIQRMPHAFGRSNRPLMSSGVATTREDYDARCPAMSRAICRAAARWSRGCVHGEVQGPPDRSVTRPPASCDDQHAGRDVPRVEALFPEAVESVRRRRSRGRAPPIRAGARRETRTRKRANSADHLFELLAALVRKPGDQQRVDQRRRARHAQARAVQKRAAAAIGREQLVARSGRTPRRLRPAVHFERDATSRRSAGRARSSWCRRSDRTSSRCRAAPSRCRPAPRRARRDRETARR